MTAEILIVDDEADIREVISDLLQDEGFKTRVAENGEIAISEIKQCRPHLMILDIWLGAGQLDGIKILEMVHKEFPDLPVIMMSGHGNIETAVNSIKKGAYDFIEKPFKADRLLMAINRALEAEKLRRENKQLKQMVAPEMILIGESAYVQHLKQSIEKIASTNSRVFLNGPSGSGKEVIARLIHNLSARSQSGSFVVFNCANTNLERFEEELFGREVNGRLEHKGALELAHGGTILLDGICDMPLPIQSQLARVVQEGAFRRLGGDNPVHIDARIITASNRNSEEAIQKGVLREELFYRLNVVNIQVSPLKERSEDIPQLAEHFLNKYCKEHGQGLKKLSDEVKTILQAYSWPGNVRQLKNVIEWILIMNPQSEQDYITPDMLPPEMASDLPTVSQGENSFQLLKLPLKDARDYFERQYLVSQVTRFSGNISKTAKYIGMERSALHRKMKSLGLARTGTDDEE